MSEPHLDHPGDMHWYSGHNPHPVIGSCPHTACPHNMMGAIAEGPDFDHYTLNVCAVDGPDGCNHECRAWSVEYPAAPKPPWFTPERPKFKMKPWLYVPAGKPERG